LIFSFSVHPSPCWIVLNNHICTALVTINSYGLGWYPNSISLKTNTYMTQKFWFIIVFPTIFLYNQLSLWIVTWKVVWLF
jgi:hypothetical protein